MQVKELVLWSLAAVAACHPGGRSVESAQQAEDARRAEDALRAEEIRRAEEARTAEAARHRRLEAKLDELLEQGQKSLTP